MVGVKGQVQARGVARREAIVDAAVEHFAREGYRGIGIARIARDAGVTTGGVLHHFGSKENLLVEVLKRRDSESVDEFEGMWTESVANDFAIWVNIASWNEKRASVAALYTILRVESIDPEHPASAYFQDRTKKVLAGLERTLRGGIDSGELRSDVEVVAKALEIFAFIEGATFVWLERREPGALRAMFEAFFADQLLLMSGD